MTDAYESESAVEGRNRNFKQAVSWLFHSEEYETVQDTFDLTDQQMEDAVAVSELLGKFCRECFNSDFDEYNMIHEWSNK